MFKVFACRSVRQSLPDYVTHRLSSAENARIERHLSGCSDCAAARHSMAVAVAFTDEVRDAPLPSSLSGWNELRAMLPTQPAAAPIPGRRGLPLAIGMAVVVVVAAVSLWTVIAPRVSPNSPLTVKAGSGQVVSRENPSVVFDLHPGTHPHTPSPPHPLTIAKGRQSGPKTDRPVALRLGDGETSIAEIKGLADLVGEGWAASSGARGRPSKKPGLQRVGVEPSQSATVAKTAAPGRSAAGSHVSVPVQSGSLSHDAGFVPLKGSAKAIVPGLQAARPGESELAYLNPDPETSLTPWTNRPPDAIRRFEKELEQRVKGGDDFVTMLLPPIAGQGPAAVKAAIAAHDKEAAIVDARLVREISLRLKAVSFADLCLRLTDETGIRFTANRRIADDKVTIFCHPRALRSIMRLIARHFGFAWVRKGEEGAYEYELTQTLRSQLLEEGLRDKDQEEMLLAVDRQMERFRKYRGMSLEQINAIEKTKDNFSDLFQLQMGGVVPINQFFALSRADTDALRAGQTLSIDLMARDTAGLPPNAIKDVWHSFDESYARERKAVQERGGDTSYIPDHPTKLVASLRLDRGTPGEFVLKGDLSDQQTGLVPSLAVAKSPAFNVENAKSNSRLAADPELQRTLTMKPASTCRLDRTPYPDTDSIYERAGDKLTTADVLQNLFDETGIDVLGDYFSHLQDPGAVTVKGTTLFAALNQLGDAMRMRWTKTGAKKESWLQFRTSAYYYDRPQEIPNRLLERWKTLRKRQGVMSPEDLCEVGQLPDAQLDSAWMSQSAIAVYGLEEWQMGRIAQLRPHWRFVGRLSDTQRSDVWTEKGLAYGELSADLQGQFLSLAFSGDADRPGRHQVRSGSLRGRYAFATHPLQYGGSYAVLQSNPLLFVYTTNTADEPGRMAIVGPWNGIYGMRPEMLKPDAFSILPGR